MADQTDGQREVLDAAAFVSVMRTYRDALRAHQEDLNRLNVYPVPDGDTGTNMALTMESVAQGLDTAETMAEVCSAVARGSLMGARGNSGVITSQILRGMTDQFSRADAIDAPSFVTGLRAASDAAYEGVLRPVEGTILTVVREAAEAIERLPPREGLLGVLEVAADEAHASVARTPELLPVLADAGVVDAGGRGFTLLLDSFLTAIDGRPLPEPTHDAAPAAVTAHMRSGDVSLLRYEVMFLLDADDGTVPALKGAWGALGDSIVVVGGDGLWNCHVHTNDIGAAIEAGIEAGRPHEVRVTDLFEEVDEHTGRLEHEEWVANALETDAVAPTREAVTTAVVAVGVGDGISRLLTSLGVQAVVAGGQSMNPSTEQILVAVNEARASSVIVLPNNKNIVPVARQVDGLTDRAVDVVPTASVVEALGALLEYDPHAEIADNVTTMTAAARRIRTGEVTQAVRDSTTDFGAVARGDWIAIERSGICAAAPTAVEALTTLVDRLVDDDSEILTVLTGAEADPRDNQHIEDHLGLVHPHVEVEFHAGDQPLYPYLVGVE